MLWAHGKRVRLPHWVAVLEVAELWHVPPWEILGWAGEKRAWVLRQLRWTQAKRERENLAVREIKHG